MFIIIFILSLLQYSNLFAQDGVFRFYNTVEITTLDPAKIAGNEIAYFYSALFTGLYKYENKKGLVPDGGVCKYTNSKKIICQLNRKMKWSDGTPVVAADYIRAYQHVIDPDTKSREAGLLITLKNAKKILKGEVPFHKLGISSTNIYELIFELEEVDYDFLYKTTSVNLTPWKKLPEKGSIISNGPYQLKSWEKNKPIQLTKNPYYPNGNPLRPDVEMHIIPEHTSALNMYEIGQLSLVQMIPTNMIPKYKNRPGFVNNMLTRFDYIGFGPQLKNNLNLRKALSMSPKHEELKILFGSPGKPGCPSFPDNYVDKPYCVEYNIGKAQAAMKSVDTSNLKLEFDFTANPDLLKGAEWYQNQWKKNLNLDVELRPIESGSMTQLLIHSPPPIFRRGVALDRPTCLSALETFKSDNKDNFIQLKSKKYDALLELLASTQDLKKRKVLCRKGLQFLIDNYWIIPQGAFAFAMLIDPRFKGWKINELNQLDLAGLQYIDKK